LAIAPEVFWSPLSAKAKCDLASWLKGIEHATMYDDNWHFFVILVQEGLRRVGIRIDPDSREFHLNQIDNYYLGDGWYGDGPEGFVDHYNGYAFHTYGLLFASLENESDCPRVRTYVDRARSNAETFRYWFGDDGSAVPFGRSMIYRFGMASMWGALAVAGIEALPWSEIRGLWARHVRSWLGKSITDEAGRLTLGYANSNALVVEEYSSPNSPYWAMKALLPLSLPENHPFWQAEEAPFAEVAPTVSVPTASFIAHRRRGHAILLPGATQVDSLRNAADKYGKFAYSSEFGFAVESDRWLHLGYAGDNVLALSPDGRHWRVREGIIDRIIAGGGLSTRWSPWEECLIETVQVFLGEWELRAHRIESRRQFEAIESGFALPCFHSLRDQPIDHSGRAIHRTEVAVSALLDQSGGRISGIRQVMPNTNLVSAYSSVPVLKSQVEAGVTVLAALVYAQPGEIDIPALPRKHEVAEVLSGCFASPSHGHL
jgi:hypothetical protein